MATSMKNNSNSTDQIISSAQGGEGVGETFSPEFQPGDATNPEENEFRKQS
jgi:hypothetical protein